MLSKLTAEFFKVSEQVLRGEFPGAPVNAPAAGGADDEDSDRESSSSERDRPAQRQQRPPEPEPAPARPARPTGRGVSRRVPPQQRRQQRDEDMEDDDADQQATPRAQRMTMDDSEQASSDGDDRSVAPGAAALKTARTAAERVWERTKVVRSKFPKPPAAAARFRKLSSTMPRRGSSNNARGPQLTHLLSGAAHEGSGEQPAAMFDSMKHMWEADVFALPVCKDLPRLVRRVCVVDKDEEIMFLAPGAAAPETTMPKPKASAEAEAKPAEPRPEPAPHGKRASKLSRWSLRRKKDGHKSLSAADMSSNGAVSALMVDLMSVLLIHLEPEGAEREAALERLRGVEAGVTEGSDMQLVSREMIEAVGADSATVRVLKTIHQNVVLQSMVEIKHKLTMKFPTRDVRSPEGWRIVVWLARGYVQVRHARREQSVDAFGDAKNHWEFEWELRMTFDRRMAGMTAAQLRVTRLILSETMEEELAEELKRTLVDGLIVM